MTARIKFGSVSVQARPREGRRSSGRRWMGGVILMFIFATGTLSGVLGAEEKRPAALVKADALFEKQNWKEAAALYRDFLEKKQEPDDAWHASLQLSLCHLRMEEYDQALEVAEETVRRFQGTIREARAERVLGNLYLTLPHWGTEKGGKFYRNRHDQGIYKYTYALDRQKAVEHLERARDLYIAALAEPHPSQPPLRKGGWGLSQNEAENLWKERLDAQFDLVAAVTRFGPYDQNWNYWWYAWGGEEEAEDDTVDEFHGLSRGRRGDWWGWHHRGRPNGIPVDVEGQPIWDPIPEAYSRELPPGQKMKFLLHEIERLDRSETKDYAALAVYRRAMLARARYGPDRLQQYANWWDGESRPYADELEKKHLYDLADDEALTLLGTRLAVVKLPPDEDIVGLLRRVVEQYRQADIAHEAQYALAVYFQSREQYTQALDEYLQYRELFPQGARLKAVRQQEEVIKKPEVGIEQLGVMLAGDPATVAITHRNVTNVHFKAYTLDLPAYLDDVMDRIRKDVDPQYGYYDLHNLASALLVTQHPEKEPRYKKYLGALVAEWDSPVEDDGSHRYRTTRITTPLKARGCRLLEATVEGGNTSQNLILLQDLALVVKNYRGKLLHFICDARSGQPVGGAKLHYFQFWQRYEKQGNEKNERHHWYVSEKSRAADEEGISIFEPETKFQPPQRPEIITLARTEDGRMAFSGVNYWSYYYQPSRQWSGRRAILFTDRPVYRPGQTVHVKLWCRTYQNGVYQPPTRETLSIEVRNPKGEVVLGKQIALDDFGGGGFDFQLDEEPPLGIYSVNVPDTHCVGNQFRVEEYKKPEFEVTVEPATDLAKLGEEVSGVIRARYYFGAPVTNATVKYRIYREDYTFSYTEPGEWDWLYGPGYGLCWYDYEWFPWWRHCRCWPDVWYPWWGPRPAPTRELVQEGEAPIGEDGTVKFTFDTAPAKEAHPDKDHLYTVEAEVRDASRRVITGSGQVKVARQEFYTFVQVDRGYYQPGQQIFVTVRTLTPGGKPVSVKGKVVISRVRYSGPTPSQSPPSKGGEGGVLEEPEQPPWEAETDAEGKLTFSLKAGKSGQYKIAFESPLSPPLQKGGKGGWSLPSKGGEGGVREPIVGATMVWVAGGDFDGRIYRFADLEILTDKRTYAPGEVAHLLLNCAREGATVLFSHRMDGGALTNYQLIPLPNRSKTIDLPIEKGDVPNFFVEATVVFDGQVHQEAREVCVPPTEGMVKLAVKTDKAEYRPGEKGRITVQATTPDGKPVKTQVALTAFDKSVLYIQPEFTPDIRAHYWGQKRYHNLQMQSSLQHTFHRVHGLDDPRMWGLWDPTFTPLDWRGSWGKQWVNWATDDYAVLVEGLEGGMGGGGMMRGGLAARAEMAAPEAAPALEEGEAADAVVAQLKASPAPPPEPTYQTAQVRTEFADTALWLAALETDEKGQATAEITFPENLTTWKVRALGMTKETRVGDADTSAVTTKNLLVRLQTPRFFMERDRVTLTANVHNYLKQAKRAKVTLTASDRLLEIVGDPTTTIEVPAGGEGKVDWEVAVRQEGEATVKVEALTDEESDAMQMSFPVLVHGIDKTVSTTGSLRPGDAGVAEVALDVPAERNPSVSRLEVRFSPSLAGAILDALPYLLDYPYGCTEQTLSRFLPAVLVQRTLQQMGLDLEDLARRRTNLNAQELDPFVVRHAAERSAVPGRRERWRTWRHDPVFSTKALNQIIRESLERLYESQKPDGGWGWWPDDRSSSYLTAYVVWGLHLAAENDVAVDQNVLNRGFEALQNNVRADVESWKAASSVWNDQAFIAYVLSLRTPPQSPPSKGGMTPPQSPPSKGGERGGELYTLLFDRRIHLTNYGKALLSLALRQVGQTEKADLVLQNIRQFEQQDDENQTTWYDTNRDGWWFWWNNDIETNAWILKAILAKNPKDPAAPRLIKWLLNNRQHGYYWRSTRDTAVCATAFTDYMRAVGEDRPNYTLRVLYDGKVRKEVKLTPDNFLSFDNRFTLAGDALASGRHTLRFERVGDGALYFNTYLSYFTKEEGITKAGLEIQVERQYYKLERADRTETVAGSRLQDVQERRVRYKRIPLKEGDVLESGDLVEVELRLISKNDYDYLVFEDLKAAGFEPVEVRSGSHYGELCSNMELRDEKVAFFVTYLTQGEHLIQYRMRAEIPGVFHALPTKGWAMYAPELRANSDETVIRVRDQAEKPGPVQASRPRRLFGWLGSLLQWLT